jgi:thiol-disulfide isomerase/thioredoxin
MLAAVLLTAAIHPTATISPDSSSTDTTEIFPLTTDLINRYISVKQALTTFWPGHSSLMEDARASKLDPVVHVGADSTPVDKTVTVFDYVALTAQDSTLAALFKTHHFLPEQFAPTQTSVYRALYALVLKGVGAPLSASDTTGVAGQNLALVRGVRQKLAAVGAAVSPPRMLGRPAAAFAAQRWLNLPKGSATPKWGDGQIYVVDFTAHWCGPCQMVYPVMTEIAATYAKRGVHVLYATQLYGYYGDTEDLTPAAEVDSLTHYITDHGFVGPVAVLPNVPASGFGPPQGNFGYPLVVVIDGHGVLRNAFQGSGSITPMSLSGAIDPLLAPNSATAGKESPKGR